MDNGNKKLQQGVYHRGTAQEGIRLIHWLLLYKRYVSTNLR